MNCPCHSGREFDRCCGRFISQRRPAENALQLMRSRYSAFALGDGAYLAATWHPDFRPADIRVDTSLRWVGLTIVGSDLDARPAVVEFEARFLGGGRLDVLHERSRFVFDAGRWWYTDGDSMPPLVKAEQPGRNQACPCGSGLKFKRCCGAGHVQPG